MKTLRQAIKDALASGTTDLVQCTRIERRDGKVFRYTEHDRTLTMSNGAVYIPNPAILPSTAVSYGSDGQSVTVDLEGALDANNLPRDEFVGGLWDFADVYVFRTLASDPVEDDDELTKGIWGKTEIKDQRLVSELRGVAVALEQKIGRVHQSTCDADLGDARCKVRLDPPQWQADTSYSVRESGEAETGDVVKPTAENGRHFRCVTAGTSGSSEPSWDTTLGATTTDGTAEWEAIQALTQKDTVQSVTGPGEFTGTLGFPDDWFGAGTVTFTSGQNAGIEKEVKTYQASVYELWQAMPFPVEVGDTFTAQAGCRKRFQEDCIDKLDNAVNHRAKPHLPGRNNTLKFGGQ